MRKIVVNNDLEASVELIVPLLADPIVAVGKKGDIEAEGRRDQAEEGGLSGVAENRRYPPSPV